MRCQRLSLAGSGRRSAIDIGSLGKSTALDGGIRNSVAGQTGFDHNNQLICLHVLDYLGAAAEQWDIGLICPDLRIEVDFRLPLGFPGELAIAPPP